MSLNKKVLSLAVLGALASGSAFAADLSAPGGAVPAYFAKEIVATAADPVELGTSASTATELNWNIGYSFSDGEVRYMRLQCSDNLQFDAGTTVTTTAPGASIGSVNGLGTNVMTFSLTAGATPINATNTIIVSGDHSITGTDSDVTCSTALYDQPSQAQAGGEVGRIAGTVFSGAYLSFVPSYELVSLDYMTNVAEVESDPAYTEFSPTESDEAGTNWAHLGNFAFRLRDPDGDGSQTTTFNIAGNNITLAQLFSSDTSLTVSGDYSAFSDAYLEGTLGTTGVIAASENSAEFDIGTSAFTGTVHVDTNGDAIPASEYFVTLNAVANASGDYSVSDISNVAIAEIVRNGTQLQAPLVQLPGGGRWQSRVVLTNTGSNDRTYSIAVQTEEGVNVNPGTLTGEIAGNSTLVLNVGDIVSFPGRARATLNVTVNAPNDQIQGLYQIVDVDNGGISNETMVRPGSN